MQVKCICACVIPLHNLSVEEQAGYPTRDGDREACGGATQGAQRRDQQGARAALCSATRALAVAVGVGAKLARVGLAARALPCARQDEARVVGGRGGWRVAHVGLVAGFHQRSGCGLDCAAARRDRCEARPPLSSRPE